jgi:hypothetical protein
MGLFNLRHEIDRLHNELSNRVVRFATERDKRVPLDEAELNQILIQIRRDIDNTFGDVVCNINHLENNLLEVVATAYVKGQSAK